MLRLSIRRIKQGKESRLRAWLAELSERAEEVRATFIDETVRHEQAYILELVDGPALVYAMEFASAELGRTAFSHSKHRIDSEHKQVMNDCLGDRLDLLPLYDVAIDDPQSNSS